MAGYSRVQVAATGVFATLAALKIYHIYLDGDCKFIVYILVYVFIPIYCLYIVSLKNFKAMGFRTLIKLPYIRGIAQKQLSDVDKTVVKKCREMYGDAEFLIELPENGMNYKQLIEMFATYQNMTKVAWREGRASGTVYSDLNSELTKIISEVYSRTAYTNPLHPDVFPEINKMEAEVVRMVLGLFNGDDDACGVITSGGTESIVLALKAYRDYARSVSGITRPEVVLPVTAHAAFQKACQYFCIKFRPIPVDPVTFKADLKAMRKAINGNTILLVGSACNYPHGIIDDIQSIAQVITLLLFK